MQTAVYALAAVGGVCALRKKGGAALLMIPVTVLGGALYHLIFEAKAQYAYPYMVYMLPLAAAGVVQAGRRRGTADLQREKMGAKARGMAPALHIEIKIDARKINRKDEVQDMKKKMLALMLMLLAALSALTAAAEGSLPDVGEIISGFKVTQLYALDALGGTVVHMEHEKTGAQLIYLANEDVNRTFSIGFRTKYDNDKGVPHVF